MSIFFTGCTQTSDFTPSSYYLTGKIYPQKDISIAPLPNIISHNNEATGFIIPLTGEITKTTQIGGHITIQNNTLLYSGIFSLVLPNHFTSWEYSTGIGMESLSMSHATRNITISVDNNTFSTQRVDDKTKCNDTIGEIITSTSKRINGQTIYIHTVRYPETSSLSKELCFIYNYVTYRISFPNITAETNKSILSLHFLKQKTYLSSQKPFVYTGHHFLFPQNTGMYHNLIISGANLIYKNLFNIQMPESLQYWQVYRFANYPIDLYFVDKLFESPNTDDIGYLHFVVTPISLYNEPNEEKTCISIQGYDLPYTTKTALVGTHMVYYFYRSYDSFGYFWHQGNICFFDKNFVYNLTLRLAKKSDIIKILDSFTFID